MVDIQGYTVISYMEIFYMHSNVPTKTQQDFSYSSCLQLPVDLHLKAKIILTIIVCGWMLHCKESI